MPLFGAFGSSESQRLDNQVFNKIKGSLDRVCMFGLFAGVRDAPCLGQKTVSSGHLKPATTCGSRATKAFVLCIILLTWTYETKQAGTERLVRDECAFSMSCLC